MFKVLHKLKNNVSLKQAERMNEHMITLYKSQVKPQIYKQAVINSFRIYRKYLRVVLR